MQVQSLSWLWQRRTRPRRDDLDRGGRRLRFWRRRKASEENECIVGGDVLEAGQKKVEVSISGIEAPDTGVDFERCDGHHGDGDDGKQDGPDPDQDLPVPTLPQDDVQRGNALEVARHFVEGCKSIDIWQNWPLFRASLSALPVGLRSLTETNRSRSGSQH